MDTTLITVYSIGVISRISQYNREQILIQDPENKGGELGGGWASLISPDDSAFEWRKPNEHQTFVVHGKHFETLFGSWSLVLQGRCQWRF